MLRRSKREKGITWDWSNSYHDPIILSIYILTVTTMPPRSRIPFLESSSIQGKPEFVNGQQNISPLLREFWFRRWKNRSMVLKATNRIVSFGAIINLGAIPTMTLSHKVSSWKRYWEFYQKRRCDVLKNKRISLERLKFHHNLSSRYRGIGTSRKRIVRCERDASLLIIARQNNLRASSLDVEISRKN